MERCAYLKPVAMLVVLVILQLLFVAQFPFLVNGRPYYTATCNGTLFDETRHMCCDGVLRFKRILNSHRACCGTESYRCVRSS
ncbi:hypothetical protein LSAT2_006338 [Lamellibrachia satsuma]|nr:hypothetical protein LSAT2_006338 [Lamellibrachia satsuma]